MAEAHTPSLMPQINTVALKQVVRHVMLEANEVPFIWGQFGAGKTETIAQALGEAGAEICDIRLGQQDTVDMRGFPGVDHKTAQTIWYTPSNMPFVGNDQWPDDRPIGLVFDEANQGLPQVLGNAYQLTNERRLGEHILKPNVRIILMGNREVDRGIANRVPLPLCNRLVHFELTIDVRAFCEYALTQGIPSWLIAFWLFRSELVNTYDPSKPPEKIVATPRTWFKFAKFITSPTMPEEIKTLACMGSVGRGPALEAIGYKEIAMRVPSIKQIVNDPRGTPVPNELSMEYAIAVKIAGSLNAKNCAPIYTYLKRMKSMFVVLAWTMAGQRDESLMTTPEFLDFGQTYRDVFSAHG